MSAEYVADKVLDAVIEGLAGSDLTAVDDLTEENVRSGGYWFTFTYCDKHYQVEVTEVSAR